MTIRITRAGQGPAYSPPHHRGVDARRLQGLEAGPTQRFWVGMSLYHPGGAADTAPTAQETVYVVLDGDLQLTVESEGIEETLWPGDSVHLPRGTVRGVRNLGDLPARLLVIMATS